MRLTDATEVKLLANGFVAVFEGTAPATLVRPADQFSCGDLYHGYPEFTYAADYEGDWYPESPSDLIQTCTAVRVGFDNGSACVAGHRHFTDAEYFDADEMEAARQGHFALPLNARAI
jgi:hypothetical protein